MGRKIVIASTVLVGIGLILIAVSDPSLRAAASGGVIRQPTENFTSTGFPTGGFNSTIFPAGGFNSTSFRAIRGTLTTDEIYSVLGMALVGGGLLLEVFSIFLGPVSGPPETKVG
jgi:hypothetical protein